MSLLRASACALCLAALAVPARAQLSTAPPGAVGSTTEPAMGAGTGLSMGGNMSPEVRSRVEAHMRAMQDLRQRMATATTPEQRQSLMNEHMRLMDENMSLMQQLMMGSGGQMPSAPGTGVAPPGPATGGGMGSGSGTGMPSGAPGSVR